MPICGHCGREAQPDDRYCQACGAPLGAQNGHAESGSSAPVAVATAVGRIVVRSLPSETSALPDEEREFVLDGRDISVGRAPSCDIVLEGDQLASRRHALLRFQNGRYTIVDLGSSNGTYVNDLEIREAAPLQDHDRITVGGHELTFSTAPASPRASLAGVRADQPPAGAPLNETNPSISVVNVDAPYAPSTGMSGAIALPLDVEPAEAPADEASEADQIIGAADDEEPQAVSDVQEAAAGAAADEAAAPAIEADSFVVAPAVSIETVNAAISTGWLTGDLEELRAQLNEISTTLAQRASEEAQRAQSLRNALGEMRSLLTSLLERQPNAGTLGDVSDLVTTARQAAEHPRHLDYLSSLAEHAGQIADALEASQAVSNIDASTRSSLEGLRSLLDELLS